MVLPYCFLSLFIRLRAPCRAKTALSRDREQPQPTVWLHLVAYITRTKAQPDRVPFQPHLQLFPGGSLGAKPTFPNSGKLSQSAKPRGITEFKTCRNYSDCSRTACKLGWQREER